MADRFHVEEARSVCGPEFAEGGLGQLFSHGRSHKAEWLDFEPIARKKFVSGLGH
jgi:hypothetical protein